SVKTFIYSICRYQWLNSKRKTNRIESFEEDVEIMDMNDDLLLQIEKAEKYKLLQFHLSKMNTVNQQILELYFQKFSTEEIAEKLGLSRLYVKKMKYISKKKLIASVQKDFRFEEYCVN
ncbi:MAG: RNA polymerase sigma factor (sigma-70 family), partial [Saprospiraceae bacterium]